MDCKQPSFADAFETMLPRELQQAIFKMAATDNSDEINISLTEDDEPSLQAPAIDFLMKLKQEYPATMYSHALSFLTGPTMRWVLESEWEPHRRVLATFRANVPMDIRRSIKYVYMPKVTTRGVIDPSTLVAKEEDLTGFINLPELSAYSRYLHSLRKEGSVHGNAERWIQKDVKGSILLFPYVFPCLEKLDFSLDMFDCLPPSSSYTVLTNQLSQILQNELGFGTVSTMMTLASLRSLRSVTNVDIRIFWDDFFRRDREFCYSISKEDEDALKNRFIQELGKKVPAKSIISYSKHQGVYVMENKITN